ncbi:TPA: HDIG domain-containing protein [Candidatus Scatousia excrementigallinarum]|uniref:HDIG domain-containing protein n=1 Tax=Candidatus Scatousia excrementigallinarum TaxID=2840935 RepID=A0A9D1F1G4_9BACT|nr:HDIG domain-containing protein [Candidatus Scatousia excrementigallinarum]
MNKLILATRIRDFFFSSQSLKTAGFVLFTVLMTAVIASQNFFFQTIVENGISKKDVVAQKTITVVDVKRTEQHKKEVAQKVEPILAPAEDDFIKSNLDTLENSIIQIRRKDVTDAVKLEELSLLFDISNESRKDFVINFFLKSDDQALREAFDKANLTLTNILQKGISEKDFESVSIDSIIKENLISNVSRRQISIIDALLSQVIVPNLVIDEFATEIARKNAENAVKPYEITFQKGDKILFEGEPVTRLKRDALRQAGYNVYELNWQGLIAIYILVFIATLIFITYMKFFEKQFLEPRYMAISATLALILAGISVVMPTGFSPYVLPIPAFVLLLAIFTNPRVAFVSAIVLLTVLTVGAQYSAQIIVTFSLLSLVSMITISQIRYSRRFDLIKAGFIISLAGLLILISIYVLERCLIDVNNLLIFRNCVFIALNGIISSMIALGTLPLFESMFKINTPYGLAELADHNQPLLKRLQFEAPGTYHHSLMVSNLCEAAAEAIGANPILARVGAFYHDIGKLKRPLFFVENQSYFGIENPHTKLNPRLSKMVITAHPKDGIELAKEYGLPPVINNFILQHHGEGLASYFYNQAVKEEGAENVKEEQFRYTGPKPNMKETAILMIADAVESAVRSLKNPTSEEIEKIIDKIIVERLNDGQLTDSPLTLHDIKVIAATFSRILRGMQHNRIKYQENIEEELKKNKINLPSKMLDEDLENKIKQLEDKNSNEGKNEN